MTLNLKTMSGAEIGRKPKLDKTMNLIADRKRTMQELQKRASELKDRSVACRRSDPIKSRLLEHQSIVLQDEAYRMRKESERPLTSEQIRRSVLYGKRALLVDEIKRK